MIHPSKDYGNFTYISDSKLTQGAVASPHGQMAKSDNAFPWVSAHIYGSNIGAPIEDEHSILHVSDHLPHTNGHTSNS